MSSDESIASALQSAHHAEEQHDHDYYNYYHHDDDDVHEGGGGGAYTTTSFVLHAEVVDAAVNASYSSSSSSSSSTTTTTDDGENVVVEYELVVKEALPSISSSTTWSVNGIHGGNVDVSTLSTMLVSDTDGILALISVDVYGNGNVRGIIRDDTHHDDANAANAGVPGGGGGTGLRFRQDGMGGTVRELVILCFVIVVRRRRRSC